MNKTIRIAMIGAALLLACFNVSAWDLKDVIKSKSDTAATASSKDLGSVISGVVNAVTNQKPSITDLEGTWKYSAPAVVFQSDNLLKKAGGMAASNTVENKLKNIYSVSGITGMTMTFNSDSTFVMNVKKVKAQGTITTNADGNYVFNFKAIGKVKVGQMTAYVTKVSGSEISLTFDASKLMTIVEKVAQFSNNSTLKGASSILESYDGVTVGFKLKK
ncbi:MAG: DUF4923 family protein [Muribaculaceae bacterium]|nr:DUF4923 family protein [Muribaculaceae bacterium]